MSDALESEIENLNSSIDTLREQLNGIGIEIYHLNSTLSSLNANVLRLCQAIEGE